MKVYAGAPAGARHYLEADQGRADDYYLTEGNGMARRYTAGQDVLVTELAPLTGEHYEAWVAGLDPATGEPRGRLRTDDRAVRFLEVVVNGPKSWSLAAALHAEIARAYEAAQDRAAGQIIGWLAQHATTRVGPAGAQVQVRVERLDAVTVRHYTSRAGDPHRHLHLQINARVFAAGNWRGLHTIGVRDSLAAINGIGHAAVATDPQFRAALAARGYTLNATGEIRELAEFVGSFSARAAQIGRNVDRYERAWTVAHPGETPGPAMRTAWDRRAWAEGRPDKVVPRPGADVTGRWLAELADLGYRDPKGPVALRATSVGRFDRDAAAETAVARLSSARSAWNAADLRGEVEQLIVAAGIVVDAAVWVDLAEDLTARALDLCDPVLSLNDAGFPFPEHLRIWTSRSVLDVEADLNAGFAARSAADAPLTKPVRSAVAPGRLDAGQAAGVVALAGTQSLVVVEGAAGAGKTATLSMTRRLLEQEGRRLVVVTPTLKAAKVARTQVGAAAGSAAAFAYAHGWRWDENGTWTRLRAGHADPLTGRPYTGPDRAARLTPGDLLVVDEAGMLDQDTARALLTVADECRVRVALVGDRHQLAAVGRGGVLDLAARHVDPEAHLTLEGVHRFTRTVTDGDGGVRTVPDTSYAELTLAMRTGEEPGAVFDALVARGQIRVHPDAAELQEAIAGIAAGTGGSRPPAVVVDTREQMAELNAVIRERLVAAGRVDDGRVVTTGSGQRIGAGDRVATRRNDTGLGVANRDLWIVTAVNGRGAVGGHPGRRGSVRAHSGPLSAGEGARVLPSGYVTEHVELAYASTAHGVQGDTVPTAHLVVGEHTGAASAYVGMTRGHEANTAHLIAGHLADAREQWIAVFTRDRADLGPGHAGELAAGEAARYAPPRGLEQVLAELHEAWTAEEHALAVLAAMEARLDPLRRLVTAGLNPSGRVKELEDQERRARRNSTRAAVQVKAAEKAVGEDTDRIRTELLRAWVRDSIVAAEIAEVLLAGPGRFRQRRTAVTQAGEELAAWADAWRPYLPYLPTDLPGLAAFATTFDDPAARWKALDDVARQRALQAHPELAAVRAAAAVAGDDYAQATVALEEGREERKQLGARFGYAVHIHDPLAALAEMEQRIAAARTDLTTARARIQNLPGELALRGQPPERVAREHEVWQARRNDADEQRRAPKSAPSEQTNRHGQNRSVGRPAHGIGR